MNKLLTASLCASALYIGLVSTANATLESRLGGKAYYDPDLNITWLADANAGKGTIFDYDPLSVGLGNDGLMTGYSANDWVASITVDGISGWRLPNLDINGDRVFNIDVNSSVFDMQFNDTCFNGNISGCVDNEMGYLYWVEGITPTTPGPFINIQPYFYLSETIHSEYFYGHTNNIWMFSFYDGSYGAQLYGNLFHAWAVHDGDIAPPPIPEPHTYLMFLTGLGLLGFMLRLRNS